MSSSIEKSMKSQSLFLDRFNFAVLSKAFEIRIQIHMLAFNNNIHFKNFYSIFYMMILLKIEFIIG